MMKTKKCQRQNDDVPGTDVRSQTNHQNRGLQQNADHLNGHQNQLDREAGPLGAKRCGPNNGGCLTPS